MLIFLTLFFTNLSILVLLLLFNSYFNFIYFILIILISLLISYLTIKLKLVNQKTNFLFLQLGFYKFIFKKFNSMFLFSFYLTWQLYKKKPIEPIVDYIYIDNSNLHEITLIINTLNLLPGIICCATRKQYLIIHSLGFQYFIPSDIFILNNEIIDVYDDNII